MFVFDKGFQNPRTWSASASIEHELVPEPGRACVQYNYAKGEQHHALLRAATTRAFGCPWGTGLGAGGTNGIACGLGAAAA